jgi:hypothetical protein
MILFIIVGATLLRRSSFSGRERPLAGDHRHRPRPWAVIAGMMLMLIFLGIFVDQ